MREHKHSTVERYLRWPALIVGAAFAIKVMMGAFGWEIHSESEQITEQLTEHVEKTEPMLDTVVYSQQMMVETIKSLSEGVDAALTGECLENSFEALVRQKLIKKCKDLGVDRMMYRTANQAQSAPVMTAPADTAS